MLLDGQNKLCPFFVILSEICKNKWPLPHVLTDVRLSHKVQILTNIYGFQSSSRKRNYDRLAFLDRVV
jgi:hypothetical protein